MMKIAAVFMFACLLFSCSKKDKNAAVYVPAPPTPPPSTDSIKTYLALGDSYTIGQSVAETERFSAQTVSLLKGLRITVAPPVYIAQTGWTTATLQSAIALQNPANTFDAVSLLIGVNDQYQHLDTAGYALRFRALLENAVQFARGRTARVFVLSIPDYSATPFVSATDKPRVSAEIDAFNAINRRITTAFGISYTDITPSTREAQNNPALIAMDNLHPSGLEYKKWAELLLPKMKAVLE